MKSELILLILVASFWSLQALQHSEKEESLAQIPKEVNRSSRKLVDLGLLHTCNNPATDVSTETGEFDRKTQKFSGKVKLHGEHAFWNSCLKMRIQDVYNEHPTFTQFKDFTYEWGKGLYGGGYGSSADVLDKGLSKNDKNAVRPECAGENEYTPECIQYETLNPRLKYPIANSPRDQHIDRGKIIDDLKEICSQNCKKSTDYKPNIFHGLNEDLIHILHGEDAVDDNYIGDPKVTKYLKGLFKGRHSPKNPKESFLQTGESLTVKSENQLIDECQKSCDSILSEVGFQAEDSEEHLSGSFEGKWSEGGNDDWLQLGSMTVDSCKAWTCTFCQNAMGTLDWMKEDSELLDKSAQKDQCGNLSGAQADDCRLNNFVNMVCRTDLFPAINAQDGEYGMDITAPKAQCERIAEEIYSKKLIFEAACDPYRDSVKGEELNHLCRKEWESLLGAYREAEKEMGEKYPKDTRFRAFDAYEPSSWVRFLNSIKDDKGAHLWYGDVINKICVQVGCCDKDDVLTEPLFESSPYPESKSPEKMNDRTTAETFRTAKTFSSELKLDHEKHVAEAKSLGDYEMYAKYKATQAESRKKAGLINQSGAFKKELYAPKFDVRPYSQKQDAELFNGRIDMEREISKAGQQNVKSEAEAEVKAPVSKRQRRRVLL